MKRFCLPLIVLALFISQRSSAQVVAGPPDYLFLVNTSDAFEPYRQTVRNFVYDILETGVQGRMKDGDTYTIWTFNETVDTTTYPVLQWSESTGTDLGGRAFEFLRIRSFEGRNNWHEAQVALFSAIKGVPELTVIVISDGFHPVKGTPYDDKINEVYAQFSLKFQEEGRPFITTIVGREGKVIGAAVNTVGEELVDPTPKPRTSEPTPVAEEPVAATLAPEPLPVSTIAAPVATPAMVIKSADPVKEPAAEPEIPDEPEPQTELVAEVDEPMITLDSSEIAPADVAEHAVDVAAEVEPVEVEKVPEVVAIVEQAVPTDYPVQETDIVADEPQAVEEDVAALEVAYVEVSSTPDPIETPAGDDAAPAMLVERPHRVPPVEKSPVVDATPQPASVPEQVPVDPPSGNLATIYYGLAGACALGAVCLLGYWFGRSKGRRDSSFITQSIDHRR